MEAAPSEKAPHFCLMSSGHMSGLKTRMALGSCHCDGRTKWHMLMYLVAWIDRKVAMATKATVMEEICQSDILYVLGGAAGRMLDHKVAMATKDTDRGGLLVDAVVIGVYFHGLQS